MVLDVHVCQANAQKGGRNHGADEGGAVSAYHHGNGNGSGGDAEALSDPDHYRKHSVEIAVRIEGQGQRHA